MARLRDPYGMALEGLRAGLRAGRFGLGAPLVAAELAPTLSVSATPLREALSRLAGEGLLEDRRGRGYLTHRLEPGELEDLYGAHWACTSAALKFKRRGHAVLDIRLKSGDHDALAVRDQTEALFNAILGAGENDVLTALHQRITDRLALVRYFEPGVIGDCADELLELAGLWDGAASARLTKALGLFHQRRITRSKSLSAALRHLRQH